jgi:hypothetical protein
MAEPKRARPKIGEAFNPYKRFHGLWVPEALARRKEVTPGAKLIYGRLMRYAGKDGVAYPRVDTLGEEVGMGERQAQKHLRALEAARLLRIQKRYDRYGGQTSNGYVFLWHSIFDEWERKQEVKEVMNSNSPSPAKDSSPSPVNWSSPKESQYKESQIEESGALTGEHDPVHSGSPKESQGDSVDFGRLESYSDPSPKVTRTIAEWKAHLKALRDADSRS